MQTPDQIAADAQSRLDALAGVTLEVAAHVAGALRSAQATDDVVRLSRAYATVSRSLRMTCALSMRLARDAVRPNAPEPAVPDAVGEEPIREDAADLPERADRIDREDLYDRLPPGQLPDQIAAVARSLASALEVLPDRGAAARARCEAITGVVLPLPLPGGRRGAGDRLLRPLPPPAGPSRPDAQVLVLTRPSRPPDGRSGDGRSGDG